VLLAVPYKEVIRHSSRVPVSSGVNSADDGSNCSIAAFVSRKIDFPWTSRDLSPNNLLRFDVTYVFRRKAAPGLV